MKESNISLPRMASSYFDWLTWRNGSIVEMFNVQHRTVNILAAKHTITKYAVGWCPADMVPCKPKNNHVALMFETNERMWWTHVTKEEFEKIFSK